MYQIPDSKSRLLRDGNRLRITLCSDAPRNQIAAIGLDGKSPDRGVACQTLSWPCSISFGYGWRQGSSNWRRSTGREDRGRVVDWTRPSGRHPAIANSAGFRIDKVSASFFFDLPTKWGRTQRAWVNALHFVVTCSHA